MRTNGEVTAKECRCTDGGTWMRLVEDLPTPGAPRNYPKIDKEPSVEPAEVEETPDANTAAVETKADVVETPAVPEATPADNVDKSIEASNITDTGESKPESDAEEADPTVWPE